MWRRRRKCGATLRLILKKSIPERDITAHEAAIIEWLLEHAAVRDVSAYRTSPVKALRVAGECDCGCSSLDFHSNAGGVTTMLADAVAVYPDEQQAGLILWGRGGEIVMLEVYDCQPGSSHRFPDVSNLCTWDEFGRRHLQF